MTIVPWECGRCAVWDFTCPDTLAPSYRSAAASDPGAVAALAESRKMSKYSALDSTLYRFFPIAIETMGAFGSRSLRFIKNLGRRITLHSGDPLATCHFVQRLSVAIQQGNAASILLSNLLFLVSFFLVFFAFLVVVFCLTTSTYISVLHDIFFV